MALAILALWCLVLVARTGVVQPNPTLVSVEVITKHNSFYKSSKCQPIWEVVFF